MILITGGTGTAGSEISKALERMGVRYRSLVRNRVKAAGSASPNVDLVEADLSRPETLEAALDGVEKALLLTAVLPEAPQLERNFIRACLLYTSDAADDLLCVDLGGRRIIK